MNIMPLKTKLVWIIFAVMTVALFAFFLWHEPINWGGDIVEYYGTSESLLNHGTPNLTAKDQHNLEQILNPVYFDMKGYYITGTDGARYPVHFIFYSILLIPFRLILQITGQSEIKTLVLTNVAILIGTALYFLRYSTLNSFQKTLLLLGLFLSPFVYFIAWPGPDLLYLCTMLFSIYFFSQKKYLASALSATIASWHSQPLLIYALGMLGFYITHIVHMHYDSEEKHITMRLHSLQLSHLLQVIFILGLLFLPYLYNLIVFGVLSPWEILQDFWTEYYGFGLHNASIKKLFEQLFDLNIGLFWYLPVLFVGGGYALIKKSVYAVSYRLLSVLIVLTAIGYQTNPAWHYGTAGYGPTRHAIFILPILLLFFVKNIKPTFKYMLVIGAFVLTQLWVFSFNGWLTPNLLNVLSNNPYATFVLNKYPWIYNPTPEIFVDRTNHTDKDYPTSAFYLNNDLCTKAYVLRHERGKAIETCGYIPQKYLKEFEQSKELKDIDKERTVKTTQALLLPRAYGCDEKFEPVYGQKYVCLKTLDDVVSYTGITDVARIRPIEDIKGAWGLKFGRPQTITVPPGYGIEYYSFEGVYVDY